MQASQLQALRQIAEAMRGDVPHNWQWIGPHMSQRHFGISEERAKQFAQRHGGEASQMVQA
jgi:copper oxidase (laccase) domain-containing protein